MKARDLSKDPRLTKEQEAIRLRGLRILARMVVRAHLRALVEKDAADSGTKPGGGTPEKGADRAG